MKDHVIMSSAAETHLATDLTLAVYFFPHEDAPELPVTAGVGLGFRVGHSSHLSEI